MPPNEAKIFTPVKAPRSRVPWVIAAAVGVAAVIWFYASTEAPAHVTMVNPPTITRPIDTPQIPTSPIPLAPPAPKLPVITQATDPRSAITAIDEHLSLYLPFRTSLDDHSPHHLPIETHGAVSVHDDAAHFPGDSYLSVPHIALDNRAFAVSVWVKPEGTVIGYGILEQVDGGPGKHLYMLLRDPDKPYIGFFLNDLRGLESVVPSMGWTHLTFQFTGTHQQIWVNGILAVERNSSCYLGQNGETRIGRAPLWSNVPTHYFKGEMRELRLYDTALSSQYIRLLAGLDAGEPEKNKKPVETF